MAMKKNYVVFAVLAGVLSLAGCSGKPANEQAAEDAQKIDTDSMIPKMAARLVEECSRGGINIGCAAEKAQTIIRADSAFKAAVAEYDKKCAQNYGAKICAQGYATYLANDIAAKLKEPVAGRATAGLKTRAELLRRRQEAEAQAKAAAAAQAAAQAKAAAEEAARQAEEAAKQTVEKTAAAPAATSAPAAPKAETPAAAPGNSANNNGQ
ncbi:MAG: hypothetical protein DU429_04165 [Candidatus Tokpelaia sp.]|nr:MAG: hypothetical protein DU430_06210 [Candidatus Tokpelaia sp.]KAA6207046.1 MAG: hypothetical protein DU429_04165 [Candidatus Tokpelaia sp.]KAA6405414.1 hypothetical protein DPQ22_04975 [Candidatus Tokpelaia sp.]